MTNPQLLWAQRSSEYETDRNYLLLTINAPELEPNYKLEFPDNNRLVFEGTSKRAPNAAADAKPQEYKLDIELFADVDLEGKGGLKKHLTGKSLVLKVPKADVKEEYWPRLTKEKAKLHWLKTDFENWKDEDEQEAEDDEDENKFPAQGGMPDMGAMGMGGMGGMGGMDGGMGGMDFQKMMAQMNAMKGAEGGDAEDEDDMPPLEDGAPKSNNADDADDDDMPPLE